MSSRLIRAASLDPSALDPSALDPSALDPSARATDFDGLDLSATLGAGPEVFAVARERLATWASHRSAVMAVDADGRSDQLRTTVLLGLGLGPARVWFGCRVVEVLKEDNRVGFAYATLPGHPERGVERFTVSIGAHDVVTGRVQAWSQPRWKVLALAGPAAPWTQRRAAQQYLRRLRPS